MTRRQFDMLHRILVVEMECYHKSRRQCIPYWRHYYESRGDALKRCRLGLSRKILTAI